MYGAGKLLLKDTVLEMKANRRYGVVGHNGRGSPVAFRWIFKQGRTRGGTDQLQRAERKIRVTLSWFGLDSPNSLLLSFILQAWRCAQNISDFRLDRRRTSSDSSYGPKMSSRKAVFWKRIQESTWLQICTIWTSILFKISEILWFQLPIFLPPRNLTPVCSIFFWGGNHNTNRWKHISGPIILGEPANQFFGLHIQHTLRCGEDDPDEGQKQIWGVKKSTQENGADGPWTCHNGWHDITCPFSLRWRLREDSFDWWVK